MSINPVLKESSDHESFQTQTIPATYMRDARKWREGESSLTPVNIMRRLSRLQTNCTELKKGCEELQVTIFRLTTPPTAIMVIGFLLCWAIYCAIHLRAFSNFALFSSGSAASPPPGEGEEPSPEVGSPLMVVLKSRNPLSKED